MTIPFTYYLYHKPTGKKYYGVRYKLDCHPDDLWNKYFSSSKEVKRLIAEYGVNSFFYEVRRVFDTTKDARDWESRVLYKLRVVEKDDWLNLNYGKSVPPMHGKKHTPETLHLMSEKQRGSLNPMWGKHHTEEAKNKISIAHKGKTISDDTRKKIGEKARGRVIPIEKRHFPTTEEVKRRAKTNRDRSHKRTMEQKQRMSDATIGRRWRICPETGRRIFFREQI